MGIPTGIEAMLAAVNGLMGTIDGKLRNKASRAELTEGLGKKANAADVPTFDQLEERIKTLVGTAPEALDTLVELADALNNDPDFASTVTKELAKKATITELEGVLEQLTNAFNQGAETIRAAQSE